MHRGPAGEMLLLSLCPRLVAGWEGQKLAHAYGAVRRWGGRQRAPSEEEGMGDGEQQGQGILGPARTPPPQDSGTFMVTVVKDRDLLITDTASSCKNLKLLSALIG